MQKNDQKILCNRQKINIASGFFRKPRQHLENVYFLHNPFASIDFISTWGENDKIVFDASITVAPVEVK